LRIAVRDSAAGGKRAFALKRIETFATIEHLEAVGLRGQQLQQRQWVDLLRAPAILCLGHADHGAKPCRDVFLARRRGAIFDQRNGAERDIATRNFGSFIDADTTFARFLGGGRRSGQRCECESKAGADVGSSGEHVSHKPVVLFS